MGNGHSAGMARAFRTLWGPGAVGGMTDGQLIARFVDRRDESAEIAFEALVERHGPMVLRVARDVLRDPHSAQDAFQATFLVLARKAGSIARPEALAPWLYGVAHRVARKARVEADRRRRHERRAAELAPIVAGAESEAGSPGGDPGLGPTLHDEVARLPGSCRDPVVLCYFEGMTYDQAALRLGVTEATVRGRLARARRLLRGRLAARGATVWSLPIVPDRWIGPTARAASRFAEGMQEAAPAPVAGLAKGVLRTMFFPRLKAAAMLAAFPIVAVAGVLAQQPSPSTQASPAARVQAAPLPEVPVPVEKPARLALTLDQAVERMYREDVELRAMFQEIPSATADVLTAGLRANPDLYANSLTLGRGVNSNVSIQGSRGVNRSVPFEGMQVPIGAPRYVDAQLVPHDQYTRERPGVPTQYDVYVSQRLKLERKRSALAIRPVKVVEAQYVDAVRLRVDRVVLAFGEALAARDLARLRLEGVDRLDRLAKVAREKGEGQEDLRRIEEARAAEASERGRAVEASARALRALASLLKIPEADAAGLEVVGELGRESNISPTETLVVDALKTRPDVLAYRLGVERAKADVKLQYANRFQDAFVLARPFADQANTPPGLKSPTSFALGLTVPMPVDNKDRGDVERAKLNVSRSQGELSTLEKQVTSEVQQARRDCAGALEAVPGAKERATAARNASDTAWARYLKGTQDLTSVLAASAEADQVARVRVEVLARNYRARMALNTAVGRRVLQP